MGTRLSCSPTLAVNALAFASIGLSATWVEATKFLRVQYDQIRNLRRRRLARRGTLLRYLQQLALFFVTARAAQSQQVGHRAIHSPRRTTTSQQAGAPQTGAAG